ncbi:unnamed protein product, partial [Brenthis ino]
MADAVGLQGKRSVGVSLPLSLSSATDWRWPTSVGGVLVLWGCSGYLSDVAELTVEQPHWFGGLPSI